MATVTERKMLPLGVGDEVTTYDDGTDGHPEKTVNGKVLEVGEESFLVQWDDLEDPTEYEWQKVTIEGTEIIDKPRKLKP